MSNLAVVTPSDPTVAPGEMPPSLYAAVRARTRALIDGHYVAPQPPANDTVQAAQRFLPGVERALCPVVPDVLREWLHRLAKALPVGGVGNDINRVREAVRLLVDACGQMAAICFTDESFRAVIRVCRFFPGPAELFAILDSIEKEARHKRLALREIAAYQPPPADEFQPDTLEERAAAIARWQAVKATLQTADAGGSAKVEGKWKEPSALEVARRRREAGMPLTPQLRALLADFDAVNASGPAAG